MNHRTRVSQGTTRAGGLAVALNAILATAGLAAVAALVLEYGFREPLPITRGFLHAAEAVIVAVFVTDRFVRLGLARRRRDYLRENWIDFALMGLAAAAVAVSFQLRGKILPAGALYVLITQAYLLTALLLRAISVNLLFTGSGIHPTWLLIGSFAFMILFGSGLLMLPAATPPASPISYQDALFTATSATCVTGLIVRDTGADFTPFGQAVILVLIQLGGLGIMLFGTMLAMLIGRGLSVRGSNVLGEMLATERIGLLGRVVAFVVVVTLCLELIGAVGFYPMVASSHGVESAPAETARAIWYSVFHSVSSFCNAGFSLYSNNMTEGVRAGWAQPLRDHWQILGVMAPLIVLGGLGFPVLQDSAAYARDTLRRLIYRLRPAGRRRGSDLSRPRLSLHSKIVITASASLIVLGAVGLLCLEPRSTGRQEVVGRHPLLGPISNQKGDWARMKPTRRLREAVFQSITARTAGFNTIDVAELSDAGKLWLCGLMVVGGSPASTAGGMKTVTLALLVLTAYCVLRRRRELEAFRRSISSELLGKAITLGVLYLGLVLSITLLLCVAMRPGYRLIDLFFEACSACGTVGLSTGVTKSLNDFGKYVIVAGMFIGRLGPLTLLLALTSKMRHVQYTYPSENVVIG